MSLILMMCVGSLLLGLSWQDLKTYELSVNVLVSLLVVMIIGIYFSVFTPDAISVGLAIAGIVTSLLVAQKKAINWIGEGDILLFSILSLTGGIEYLYSFAYIITIIGGSMGLLLVLFTKKSRHSHIPFAPIISSSWVISQFVSVSDIIKGLAYVL